MAICLYIGRFQPFHLGHLDVIAQIFSHNIKNIVIGIGSINKQDQRNPRTFSQRKEMIILSLKEKGYNLSLFNIVGIPDFTDDEDRLNYITDTINFNTIMSGNPWVVGIFEHHNVKILKEQENIPIHSTQIREWIAKEKGNETKKWVTKTTFNYIKNHGET